MRPDNVIDAVRGIVGDPVAELDAVADLPSTADVDGWTFSRGGRFTVWLAPELTGFARDVTLVHELVHGFVDMSHGFVWREWNRYCLRQLVLDRVIAPPVSSIPPESQIEYILRDIDRFYEGAQ